MAALEAPFPAGSTFRGKPKVALRAKPLLKARNESRPTSHRPRPHRLFAAHARSRLVSAVRLADEERPVRRALVVLPPRNMTAASRHRQSRSARRHASLRLTALELRRRRARGRRSSGRPGGRCSAPSEPVRPRVPLPPPPPLHPIPVCRESNALCMYGRRHPRGCDRCVPRVCVCGLVT